MIDFDFELDDFNEDSTPIKQIIPMILPENENSADEENIQSDSFPEFLPILPMSETVILPRVAIPAMIGKPSSRKLVESLEDEERKFVILVTQREKIKSVVDSESSDGDVTYTDEFMPIGTIAEIVRVLEVNDELLTVILYGKKRVRITDLQDKGLFQYARYSVLEDIRPEESDVEYQALAETLKESIMKIMVLKNEAPKPFIHSVGKLFNPEIIINFASTNFPTLVSQKLSLLLTSDLKQRGYMMLKIANDILSILEFKHTIQLKTRAEMDKQQKDYFLQQQMKTIRDELNGGEGSEYDDLMNRAKNKKWKKEVSEIFTKEARKLQSMSTSSADYSVQLQYLQTMLDLPWNEFSKDNFNINNAQKILDKDHFGLEKVKERILEHLSVLKLKGNLRAPIICLYGPPGVGKTSLGKSIATALGREYVRISLGGVHDEAEIRGHRRTYIGSMPGRIIKSLIKAKTSNPVMVLDEIDKLASDYKGDPSAALLEVLDPEQNNTFHDNYLDIDYDLSQVLFVATANNVSDIPFPLRDRMEMIEVGGYIIEEKLQIAQRHLLPKSLKRLGLTKTDIKISAKVLTELIEKYTRETGVRQLDKRINEVIRKAVKAEVMLREKSDSMEEHFTPSTITSSILAEYLGTPVYKKDLYEGNKYAGVVTGLAWTSVGGEILTIESAVSPSKNGRMSLTGNLGEVMKESAVLALEYIKSHADYYKIPFEIFDYWNVHIHVPEGAIPKDGPSAGITIVTSLISTFTQRKVLPHLAMTGEITLRGKVLPVGGIKEKILAAKRSGIKNIILCEDNRKDIEEIKDIYLEGLNFIYVREISEVIASSLSDKLVEHPINFAERIKTLQATNVNNTKKGKNSSES